MKLQTYLKIAKDLNINVALLGAHGRSKTSQVRQYADEVGLDLETVILSQLLPDDLVGLPVLSEDKKTTITALPKWLEKACDEDVVLFFDEFSNAEKDVQSAILNLLETREISDKHLSIGTQIILAFNPRSIAPTGKTLSKATRDRICIIPVKDDADMFLNYYKQTGMLELVDVLVNDKNVIKNYDNECIDEMNENAELTWRSAEKIYHIVKYCVENNYPRDVATTLAVGFAGESVRPFLFDLFARFENNGTFDKLASETKETYLNRGKQATVDFLAQNSDFCAFEGSQVFAFFNFMNKLFTEEQQQRFYDEVISYMMKEEFLVGFKRYQTIGE